MTEYLKSNDIKIIFPSDGKLRSRKVVTRARQRVTGKYPSWKMQRMMQWESRNELNAFRLLDANPCVVKFYEQPCLIEYTINGVKYKHYPDVLVNFINSDEIWEIKEKSETLLNEFILRTKLLQQQLPAFGYTYRVIIAENLKIEPQLKNILTILKFGRNKISLLEEEIFRKYLKKANHITWGNILEGKLGVTGREIICRKVLEGKVYFDMKANLLSNSVFHFTLNNLGQEEA